LKVAYLVPEFPAQTHIFFWREISALRKLGVEITLISTRKPENVSKHAFADAAMKETHYLFPPNWPNVIKNVLLNPVWFAKAVSYILKLKQATAKEKLRLTALSLIASEFAELTRQYKIQHIHGHSCADAAHLVALTALSSKCTFSLTLHGDLPVYGKDHFDKFERASFIAVVTEALQKQVRENIPLPNLRLPVIRMGVDTETFVPLARTANTDILRLVTVARLAECKGHRFALQALAEARKEGIQFIYTIVGAGEERENLEALTASLGLADAVKFTGTASEDEVRGHLQAADIFLLTSVGIGEAAPVSVMEAMACGLVVISSIIGGTPEMIVDNEDGFLVEQKDVAGLTKLITRLAQDTHLREKIKNQARLKAETCFSADKFAAQLYGEIEQAIDKGYHPKNL